MEAFITTPFVSMSLRRRESSNAEVAYLGTLSRLLEAISRSLALALGCVIMYIYARSIWSAMKTPIVGQKISIAVYTLNQVNTAHRNVVRLSNVSSRKVEDLFPRGIASEAITICLQRLVSNTQLSTTGATAAPTL